MEQNTDNLLEAAKRAEAQLEELNTRIARLSMALGAPLDSADEFEKILNRATPFFQQYAAVQNGGSLSVQEHRLMRQWEELRGLLVLRCDMMTHSLNELGLQATMAITERVEAQLNRDGFTPGADGLDLFRRGSP